MFFPDGAIPASLFWHRASPWPQRRYLQVRRWKENEMAAKAKKGHAKRIPKATTPKLELMTARRSLPLAPAHCGSICFVRASPPPCRPRSRCSAIKCLFAFLFPIGSPERCLACSAWGFWLRCGPVSRRHRRAEFDERLRSRQFRSPFRHSQPRTTPRGGRIHSASRGSLDPIALRMAEKIGAIETGHSRSSLPAARSLGIRRSPSPCCCFVAFGYSSQETPAGPQMPFVSHAQNQLPDVASTPGSPGALRQSGSGSSSPVSGHVRRRALSAIRGQ